jgi:hypothetical protein
MSLYSRIKGSGGSEAFSLGVDQSFYQNAQCDKLRKNLNAAFAQGARGGWLGGSRSQEVLSASEIIVPEFWDVLIDWRHAGGDNTSDKLRAQARVEVYTNNAGTSVTPRIKNVTDSVNHDGSASTTVGWVEQTITIPVPGSLGIKRYRLYIIGSNATNAIRGIGQIEIYDPLF